MRVDAGILHSSNVLTFCLATGTAAQSPYVIAMTRASIKGISFDFAQSYGSDFSFPVLPSIINAGVITSAFSAANSYLFCSSRILYGLALRGQAPAVFSRCTSSGLPLISVCFTGIFAFLSLMNVSAGAETVFK